MAKTSDNSSKLPLVALILAWIVPGAGHIYLGRKTRGVIILVTIAAIFWGGVAMGGVMTVDYYNARWWFISEMLTGVHGVTGWYNQRRVYQNMTQEVFGSDDASLAAKIPEEVRDQKLKDRGVALNDSPTDNIARAYAGVAGMLNLLCMVDALMLSMMGEEDERKTKGKEEAA